MRIKSLFLFLVIQTLSLGAAALTVILDPGHGGADTGASYGNAKESNLVLNVAHQISKLIKEDAKGIDVHMTRHQDEAMTLPARVEKAQKLAADLFISLHANAALDSRAKGAEFFFQNSVPPDQESLYLAHQENQLLQEAESSNDTAAPSKKADVEAILNDLQRQDRLYNSFQFTRQLSSLWSLNTANRATIKQAPFYVISNTKMPSVLVEIGFLSNPKEARQLMRTEYQKVLAQKIYKAILAYKEKMDNPATRTLN